MQLSTCYKLIEVEERRAPDNYNYEHLGIINSDVIHICHQRDSPERFCLVISQEIHGAPRSLCHAFERVNFKFVFLKTTRELTEAIVFQVGNIRWNLFFTTETENTMRDLYQSLVVNESLTVIIFVNSTYVRARIRLNSLSIAIQTIGRPRDLQKRNDFMSNFVTIARGPVIQVDHQFENWKVIHITNPERNQRRPLLVTMKKDVRIYSADGDKVYMSVNEYAREAYFFTCANPHEAQMLSDRLNQYS